MRERTTQSWTVGRTSALAVAAALVVGGCSSTTEQSSTSTTKQTFCGLLVAFRASNDSLDSDVTSGDPTAAKTAIARLVSQAKALQKRAPADIVTDVATVSSFIDELDALFAKYDYDLTKLSADPAAVEQYTTINDAEAQAALDQLRAFGDVDCGDKTPPVVTTVPGLPTSTISTSTTIP